MYIRKAKVRLLSGEDDCFHWCCRLEEVGLKLCEGFGETVKERQVYCRVHKVQKIDGVRNRFVYMAFLQIQGSILLPINWHMGFSLSPLLTLLGLKLLKLVI